MVLRLPLTATPRFATFVKQRDARDHFFVQDAHLAPRFFVACPDLFAQCGEVSGDGRYLLGQSA